MMREENNRKINKYRSLSHCFKKVEHDPFQQKVKKQHVGFEVWRTYLNHESREHKTCLNEIQIIENLKLNFWATIYLVRVAVTKATQFCVHEGLQMKEAGAWTHDPKNSLRLRVS